MVTNFNNSHYDKTKINMDCDKTKHLDCDESKKNKIMTDLNLGVKKRPQGFCDMNKFLLNDGQKLSILYYE